jgi:hypothetical protein
MNQDSKANQDETNPNRRDVLKGLLGTGLGIGGLPLPSGDVALGAQVQQPAQTPLHVDFTNQSAALTPDRIVTRLPQSLGGI